MSVFIPSKQIKYTFTVSSAIIQFMKKLKFYKEPAFFIGLILLSVGMTFVVKADLGISVVQSAAYILSLKIKAVSFGTFSYIVQFLLIAILCAVIRKINIRYIVSFVSAILYGYILDLCMYLMRSLPNDALYLRIIYFAAGFYLIVIAVALFFRTNIPLMPYDIFVTDLARAKNWNINTVKIIYDICCLAAGVALSLIFYKKLVGIGIGTIITGLFSGICIKYTGKLMDKILVFTPIFKKLDKSL